MRLLILLSFVISLSSCKVDRPKRNLTRDEKAQVDSIYREELIHANIETDSLCDVYKNTRYNHIKDSIITLRMMEIENILPK